ncbi:MAG: hypothetical protein JKY48_16600 [Flavobacteriales bacterium]|nr:hypothetical protein [Flavobacteriales bacterium]
MSTMWSTNGLKNDVEKLLNDKTALGYEIVSVEFGLNLWWMPTAFVTICK